MPKVGQKFLLWRTEQKANAYTDPFGNKYPAEVVVEEIPVTVTEVREDVPGLLHRDEEHKGWKAISTGGEEFTCNWNQFPDISAHPTFFWDIRQDMRGVWMPLDACQVARIWPVVNEEGELAVPSGAVLCEDHNVFYLEEACTLCCVLQQQ